MWGKRRVRIGCVIVNAIAARIAVRIDEERSDFRAVPSAGGFYRDSSILLFRSLENVPILNQSGCSALEISICLLSISLNLNWQSLIQVLSVWLHRPFVREITFEGPWRKQKALALLIWLYRQRIRVFMCWIGYWKEIQRTNFGNHEYCIGIVGAR